VDFLLADGPAAALDVGCGTGKLGVLLQARGVVVTGVEPDERMAEVARHSGLQVEIAPFEQWQPAGRTWPMLVCAQAWHWIDPQVGIRRAAEAVQVGGSWNVVWNADAAEEVDLGGRLDAVYAAYAPTIRRRIVMEPMPPADDPTIVAVRSCAAFGPIEQASFEWDEQITVATYLERTSTRSDHLLLEPEARERLLAAVRGELGEIVSLRHTTMALRAVRR